MALPKIKQPIFTMTLPSTGQTLRYRPFTVAEEKILLVARESSDVNDIVNAYKGIINNCCLDPIDVDKLCSFDIEYLFINIRAKSVSNIVEVIVTDEEDGNKYKVEVNLDDLKVSESEFSPHIKLNEEISIVLRYPTFDYLTNLQKVAEKDQMLAIVAGCIDQIYEGETVYEASNYSRRDLEEFVMSLGMKELVLVKEFFEKMPKVYTEISYTRKDGIVKTTRLEGIQSFFD